MKKRPPKPPDPETVVRVLPPRWRANDCAIWSLSTLTGIGYDEVLLAVAKVDKAAGRNGLYLGRLVRVAALLGVTLKRKRKPDLTEDTGILGLWMGRDGHAVVLKQGQIIDVDATVWDAPSYLLAKRAIAGELLMIAKP